MQYLHRRLPSPGTTPQIQVMECEWGRQNMEKLEPQVARGMQLAAELPEIMPDDAGDRIRPVYDDIQSSLRVPFVNLIFRVLANFPDYFVPAWQDIAPIVRSAAFEQASDQLRARAALERMPGKADFPVKIESELRAFNDTIHYVLPKLLLVATLLDEGDAQPNERPVGASAELPLGIAEGAAKVGMVDPKHAQEPVARLFDRIKAAHGHPLVSSYFRALAQWPEALQLIWAELEPIVGSQPYERRKSALIAFAETEAQALSVLGSRRALPEGSEGEEIRLLLCAFRHKFIPEMLIDALVIKSMLDGPADATTSPLSVKL